MIKKFEEFINEKYGLSKMVIKESNNMDLRGIYDSLNNDYDVIGDVDIEYSDMEEFGETLEFVKIPVTTDGDIIEPNPYDGDIIASLNLVDYIDDNLYEIAEEFDEDSIFELGEGIGDNPEFENGAVRVVLKSGDWDESEILAFLNSLLNSVPNPALKQIN